MVVIKLFAACTYKEIENRERDVENKEIVVFLFVRPSCKDAMDIVREFDYIHYNSGKYCSIYAIGYTNDFNKANDKQFQKVNIEINSDWYFSTKAFTEFKNKLEKRINWNYSGEIEILILQNNPNSNNVLNFQNYIAIDVNKGIKEGYIDSFQRFMEALIRSSKNNVTVQEAIKDIRKKFSIKEIVSEAINDSRKIPVPVKNIIKDRLFYRCAVGIKA